MKSWRLALLAGASILLIIISFKVVPKSSPEGSTDHAGEHSTDLAGGHSHELVAGSANGADRDHTHAEGGIHEPDLDEGHSPGVETAPDKGLDPDRGGNPEEIVVHLSEENIAKFGIETEMAGPGEFEIRRTVPGEIVIDADRLAHIVPRVPGVVSEVRGKLGDRVRQGQVLAVIESRELADAKASYLASLERQELAEATYLREEKLWREKVSSEQEYLDAKKDLAEARIERRSAEQKLRALGFGRGDLERVPGEPADRFTVFSICAPFDGTVIEKHIALGEAITAEENVFTLADLGTVWADLHIRQSDIGLIEEGQVVAISSKSGLKAVEGVISYVDPIIDGSTRTALARVVLDNQSGRLRPGTFITADILVLRHCAKVRIPSGVLQSVNDELCVFVKDAHGFEMRPVTTGHSNGRYVEIVAGLSPGEEVVTKNQFRLKAELEKGENVGCAGHAH
ncbi:MAG: efflux RND transporter periplasmic adaptor subunit [Candidatus Krumholzibacteriota bacterium]|nr:efflux RND transporter periplasmic adaptor subunit [Candidatus Krumholzibacteriota bacterium]